MGFFCLRLENLGGNITVELEGNKALEIDGY